MSVKKLYAASAILVMGLTAVAPAGAKQVDKSDNVKMVGRVKYVGGSELAFDGKYVYAGQFNGELRRGEKKEQGGAFIIDVSRRKPKKLGYAHCPGDDADVATVGRRLLAIGYNQSVVCAPGSTIVLFDTKNPRHPKILGGVAVPGNQTHTLTPYPGKPVIYSSPGGLGDPTESIIDVKNPRKPKVAATFEVRPAGCHDWSFHIAEERKLGFCAGGGQVSIWDVSDPLAPSLVSVIANPAIEFPHYALASPDGDILAIDDEAFAGHECVSGQSPIGSVWFYDISVPEAPVPMGKYAVGRGASSIGHYPGWVGTWCTSHHFNWIPKTRNLVISWFTGGTSVLDVSNPTQVEEIAHYVPDDAVTWTAHWYRGRVLINDMARGFEMLKVKGVKKKYAGSGRG